MEKVITPKDYSEINCVTIHCHDVFSERKKPVYCATCMLKSTDTDTSDTLKFFELIEPIINE
jgi:hypothetical protein